MQDEKPSKQSLLSNPVSQQARQKTCTQKLAHFPKDFPLGHVQLYAAAAAAAADGASCIWVSRAKKLPHRPVAGLVMDHKAVLHKEMPGGKAVPVKNLPVATLPWEGRRASEPALSIAPGEK